ncbi:MAG: 4Fe-4S binding protein [Firmicutes bacterium]|nr:4Fe-4S binding protein [Bacillota bacterium]
MKRKIVRIDEEKCDGCGLCVEACHEGALQLVDGKARLVSESYCDGLGDCLPECPAGALSIEEREAAAYDEEAAKRHAEVLKKAAPERLACGCPGTTARVIKREGCTHEAPAPQKAAAPESRLRQWPCQIRLVPAGAPYLDGASLLVAADCTAYAYANIHEDFMRDRITLIGCPKLDDFDYAEKLAEILRAHEIEDITVLRMEVPCCGGIVKAVERALAGSAREVPWRAVTIGTDGRVLEG